MKIYFFLLFFTHISLATIILDTSESQSLLKTSYLNLETNHYASRYYNKKNNTIWYSSPANTSEETPYIIYHTLEQQYIQQKKIRALSSRDFSFSKSMLGDIKVFFTRNNPDIWYFLPCNK